MQDFLLGKESGRKLRGLYVSVLAVLFLAGLGAWVLEAVLAQTVLLAAVAGVSTLFATFAGANVGEHIAKRPEEAPNG